MPSYNYWWNDYYDDGPRLRSRSRYDRRRCCSGWGLMRLSLILCCITLVLQILGFVCPGWMILSIDLTGLGVAAGSGFFGFGKVSTYAAIWYTRVCTSLDSQETCQTSTYHESSFMGLQLSTALSKLASVDWVAIQVETTIALALCVLGIILCCVSFCDPCWAVGPKTWAVIVAGCMLASGVVLIPAVVNMSEAYDKAKSAVTTLSQITGQDFVKIEIPWAMILTACGMGLAVICCFLLLIAACLHHRRRTRSRIIRTDSSVSEYSYRKRPYMLPTRFYNTGPFDGSYYKDRPVVAQWGHGSAFGPEHKGAIVRAHSTDGVRKAHHHEESHIHTSHSVEDRHRERPLALMSGHEKDRHYPPSFDGRNVYRRDEGPIDVFRGNRVRRNSYPRYIGPWEPVDYPIDRLLTLPPLRRDYQTYPPAIESREIVQRSEDRQTVVPPSNREVIRTAPTADDRQYVAGNRDYLSYTPYGDVRQMVEGNRGHVTYISYGGDRRWVTGNTYPDRQLVAGNRDYITYPSYTDDRPAGFYSGYRGHIMQPPYTDDYVRYSGERLGSLAPVHRYFVTNPHPIGLLDDVHRSGFRHVHRGHRDLHRYAASLDGKDKVHRVLESNVINHL